MVGAHEYLGNHQHRRLCGESCCHLGAEAHAEHNSRAGRQDGESTSHLCSDWPGIGNCSDEES